MTAHRLHYPSCAIGAQALLRLGSNLSTSSNKRKHHTKVALSFAGVLGRIISLSLDAPPSHARCKHLRVLVVFETALSGLSGSNLSTSSNKRKHHIKVALSFAGVLGRIRTCDLWLRKPTLYPTELRGHINSITVKVRTCPSAE